LGIEGEGIEVEDDERGLRVVGRLATQKGVRISLSGELWWSYCDARVQIMRSDEL
jgi:hypothetical protein